MCCLTAQLSSGRIEKDPAPAPAQAARALVLELVREHGQQVQVTGKVHAATVVDLDLVGALGAVLQDPGHNVAFYMRGGARIGWRERPPCTPAVFARKSRWSQHVGCEEAGPEFCLTYASVLDAGPSVKDTLEEQVAEHMVAQLSPREAHARFGPRLRVASLGAVPLADGHKVVHDGTHGVAVNTAIRVRDQENA